MDGTILKISRFCTDDGPGIRTTVFLKGCPLRCIWCHNPESQNPSVEYYSNGEKIGKKVSAKEIFNEIIADKIFYETSGGGVTISGGEPLFQPEFTTEILKLCKENEIHTAIETSGFASRTVFEKVIKHCDLVLFDIKETDAMMHKKLTGVSSEQILKNLNYLEEIGKPYILRAPIIPEINDRDEHFDKLKKFKSSRKFCKGVEIMPYHILGEYKYELLQRDYKCKNIKEPDKETVEKWKNRARAK